MCMHKGVTFSANHLANPQLPEAAIDRALDDSGVALDWTFSFTYIIHSLYMVSVSLFTRTNINYDAQNMENDDWNNWWRPEELRSRVS